MSQPLLLHYYIECKSYRVFKTIFLRRTYLPPCLVRGNVVVVLGVVVVVCLTHVNSPDFAELNHP